MFLCQNYHVARFTFNVTITRATLAAIYKIKRNRNFNSNSNHNNRYSLSRIQHALLPASAATDMQVRNAGTLHVFCIL